MNLIYHLFDTLIKLIVIYNIKNICISAFNILHMYIYILTRWIKPLRESTCEVIDELKALSLYT